MDKIVAAVVIGVVILAISIGVSFISAAFLMVSLRLLHNDLPAVPALGFLASWGALFGLATIGSALRPVNVK